MIQAVPHYVDGQYPLAADTFADEESLPAAQKWQLLQDWQRFMLSGFKRLFFTWALYGFRSRWRLTPQPNQARCRHYFLNADLAHLQALLDALVKIGSDAYCSRHQRLGLA